jgi:hypothetical protein
MFREFSSIGRTIHYICRGPRFEPRSSYLSILRVEFLATRLLDQKKKMEGAIIFAFKRESS